MAQRKREKELNTNNNNDDDDSASGDFSRGEVDSNDAGDFQYTGGSYYGPGGDYVQENVPPGNHYDVDRKGYGRIMEGRRQGSDPRGTSTKNARHARSSGRQAPQTVRLSALFVHNINRL